jgi:hypothetical protein
MSHPLHNFSSTHPVRFALAIAGIIALAFACGDALRQDELDCEEAVSHLQECCPNFDSRSIACVYDDNGNQGCNPPTLPDISSSQSQCIRNAKCDAVVASGICARAAQIRTQQSNAQVILCQ